jgi:hypothetical protein
LAIAVPSDGVPTVGDRAQLKHFVAEWLELLNAGKGMQLPIAVDARITENGQLVRWPDAELMRSTKIGDYRIVAVDETAGQFGFIGQVWRGNEVSVCGMRIGVTDGQGSEIETIVGPSRFPSTGGVEARALTHARASFVTGVPEADRRARADLAFNASLYYAAVVREQPEIVPFDPDGARVEAGTQITANPAFHFDFYGSTDGGDLPNFGEWTAQEQFLRGLWNADGVSDGRYPVVDRDLGVVLACTTYRPWHKRFETEVHGVGRVVPLVANRRVALCMMEMFKIERDVIGDMESVWSIADASFTSPW